jgi:hypothetical protein
MPIIGKKKSKVFQLNNGKLILTDDLMLQRCQRGKGPAEIVGQVPRPAPGAHVRLAWIEQITADVRVWC